MVDSRVFSSSDVSGATYRFFERDGRLYFSCLGVELSYDINSEMGYFLRNYVLGVPDFERLYGSYFIEMLSIWRFDSSFLEGCRSCVDGLYSRLGSPILDDLSDGQIVSNMRSEYEQE